MFEAADTLPNMKLEVCLSEPVVLDTNVVPANIIYVVVLMSQGESIGTKRTDILSRIPILQ